MKLFTESEANELLPTVIPVLEEISRHYKKIIAFRENAKLAAQSAELGGGGMEGGSQYVELLYKIGKLTVDVGALGIQLKDMERGLIDFPSLRGDKMILLCWQLGEEDKINWWHDEDAGFAGRKPL